MGLLYTFIITALVLGVFVAKKAQELKTGKQTLITKMLAKCDPFFNRISRNIQGLVDQLRQQTFFLFLVHIPSKIEGFFAGVRVRMHDYYHGTNEKMRNKQNLSNGPVSPYMRSMTFNRDTEGF